MSKGTEVVMSLAWEQEREKDALKSHAKEFRSSLETGDWHDDENSVGGIGPHRVCRLHSRGLSKAICTF